MKIQCDNCGNGFEIEEPKKTEYVLPRFATKDVGFSDFYSEGSIKIVNRVKAATAVNAVLDVVIPTQKSTNIGLLPNAASKAHLLISNMTFTHKADAAGTSIVLGAYYVDTNMNEHFIGIISQGAFSTSEALVTSQVPNAGNQLLLSSGIISEREPSSFGMFRLKLLSSTFGGATLIDVFLNANYALIYEAA